MSAQDGPFADCDAGGIDRPGDVAWVSMMGRAPVIALYDGEFWRGVDARGPVKCVSAAVTHRVGRCCPTSPAEADGDAWADDGGYGSGSDTSPVRGRDT